MGDFRDPAVVESWHASLHGHRARGEQLDLLLALVEQAAPRRLLDVGVGSGLVAERALDLLPHATLVGVDFSPVMLEQAQTRLARFGNRAQLVHGDLADPDQIDLPSGPYDVAVSVQTLHNVDPDGQRRALAWLGRTLAPGGVAFLLDKLAVPEALYDCYTPLVDLPADHAAYRERETADGERSPLLETHLAWLREARLEPAVLDLRGNYALVAARCPRHERQRPPSGSGSPELARCGRPRVDVDRQALLRILDRPVDDALAADLDAAEAPAEDPWPV